MLPAARKDHRDAAARISGPERTDRQSRTRKPLRRAPRSACSGVN